MRQLCWIDRILTTYTPMVECGDPLRPSLLLTSFDLSGGLPDLSATAHAPLAPHPAHECTILRYIYSRSINRG